MNPSRLLAARRGFTLIEVMVALAILMILIVIGWSSMQETLPRYRMVGAAKSLRGDLMTLRNLAIQSNRETRLRLTGSPGDCTDLTSWGGSWELSIGDLSARSTSWDLLPADVDGVDNDQSEARTDLGQGGNEQARNVCLKAWDTLVGPGSDTTDSIVFSPRGWVANPGSDFGAAGYIELTLVNQGAAAKGVDDAIVVRISRAGMVRLEPTLSGQDSNAAGTTTTSSE